MTENLSNSLRCILIHGAVDIHFIYIYIYFLLSVCISHMIYSLSMRAIKDPSFNSVQISTLRNESKPYNDHVTRDDIQVPLTAARPTCAQTQQSYFLSTFGDTINYPHSIMDFWYDKAKLFRRVRPFFKKKLSHGLSLINYTTTVNFYRCSYKTPSQFAPQQGENFGFTIVITKPLHS